MDEILRKHVAAFKAALAGQAVECSPEKPINYGCQVVCRRGPEEIKVNFYHGKKGLSTVIQGKAGPFVPDLAGALEWGLFRAGRQGAFGAQEGVHGSRFPRLQLRTDRTARLLARQQRARGVGGEEGLQGAGAGGTRAGRRLAPGGAMEVAFRLGRFAGDRLLAARRPECLGGGTGRG